MREVSRQRLRVENGHYLYAEANAFVANRRGEVLLAGIPTMLMEEQPDGSFSGVAKDSILGAVIAPDGTARGVPAPIDARTIHGIRVAAREDGGWDAVFAEVPANASHRARTDSASRFWYGAYDGNRWTTLEQIPLPVDVRLHTEWTSQLVRHGDSLSWALRPVLGARPRDAVIVHRHGGRWHHETVPTGYLADLDMGHSPAMGLVLTAVQADPTLPSDGNSLILWAERPVWHRVRRLVHGDGEGPAYDPWIVGTADKLVVSWKTPPIGGDGGSWEVRGLAGDLEPESAPPITLDPNVSAWTDLPPLVLARGTPISVTHHLGVDGRNEIRFVTFHDQLIELGRIRNPYYIRMNAALTRWPEMLLTGMEYTNFSAFSLLLRVRMECAR